MNVEKKFRINLCGYDYEINTRISISDFFKIEELLKEKTVDYQMCFANLINDKILTDEKIQVIDIYNDTNLKLCAEKFALLNNVNDLYMQNCEKMGCYEAFFNSIHAGCIEQIKEVINENANINEEIISGISNLIVKFNQSISSTITPIVIQNITNISNQFSEMVKIVTKSIGEMLKDIKIPTISEEKKEELKASYIRWGEYGWTMIPESPIYTFNDCPSNRIEANKLALKYCTEKDMDSLFDVLQDVKGVKHSDLNEAIFAYKHKKYKSCSLILFGLIDSQLIRLQCRTSNSTKNKRAVGKRAVDAAIVKIQKENDLEKTFLLLLEFENIFACLKTVFEYGDDFKIQPTVINRNFVDHGMMTKRVKRMDSIQLFLLYYNLLNFLDIISLN